MRLQFALLMNSAILLLGIVAIANVLLMLIAPMPIVLIVIQLIRDALKLLALLIQIVQLAKFVTMVIVVKLVLLILTAIMVMQCAAMEHALLKTAQVTKIVLEVLQDVI